MKQVVQKQTAAGRARVLNVVQAGLALLMGAGMVAVAFTTPVQAQDGARVVSLGGTATEIVAALGASDRLIGRDTSSTYPPQIASLPDVGYVRALSPEGVLSLHPDLILAEADAGPPTAVDSLQAAGIPLVRLPGDHTADGVLARIDATADALGLPEAGLRLHDQVAGELARAQEKAAAIPAAEKRRVLFILSLQGGRVMAAGDDTAASGIIALAGASNAVAGFSGYKPLTDEAILAAAPDAVLVMDAEGPVTITAADIQAQPALAQTPAAQKGAILRMDGLLMLGFGPRTGQAAHDLYALIYPDRG